MRDHHIRTIDRLVERFKADPGFLAMIVGGSIAKGRDQENSDVDIMLVATDEEYSKRKAENNFFYWANDVCDYPDGYVDGKIIDLQFLNEVAEKGSEPARAAFKGAFIAYSHIPDLDELLKRIPVYPEHEQKCKIQSFYTQFFAARWFVDEAVKRKDIYLLNHAVQDMVFYAGRLILAHNRILYPYHKWFMTEIRNAKDKPDQFMELAEKVLKEPGIENATQFYELVNNFTQWDLPPEGWVNRFYFDVEWTWRENRTPLYDL